MVKIIVVWYLYKLWLNCFIYSICVFLRRKLIKLNIFLLRKEEKGRGKGREEKKDKIEKRIERKIKGNDSICVYGCLLIW